MTPGVFAQAPLRKRPMPHSAKDAAARLTFAQSALKRLHVIVVCALTRVRVCK